jgi:hypothetical protein
MPSRFLALGIVTFWLATTAWFVARDLFPHWRSGQAPPYSIDLTDEAVRQVVPARWRIERNGQLLGTLRTLLRANEADNTYELLAACPELELLDVTVPLVGRLHVVARNYEDRLGVTREGELRAMETKIDLVVRAGAGPVAVAKAELAAEVRGQRVERRFRISAPGLGEFAPALEPGEAIRGSVLNPLHPIHRLAGLQPGQHWRQPLVVPHEEIVRAALAKLPGAESAAAALGQNEPRWLDAAVRPTIELVDSDSGPVECLVIDYRGEWHGEEQTAHTWLRRDNGLVLRQEASSAGQSIVLIREQPR